MNTIENKVYKTKDARFAASKRIRRNRKSSTFCIALLSVEIIAINLIVFIEQFKKYNDFITVGSIALSVAILVLSLLVSQQQYESCEENYHNCGNDLNSLYLKILLIKRSNTYTDEDVESVTKRYNGIINKYKLNHEEIDYRWSLLGNTNEKSPTTREKMFLYFRWYVWDIYLFYYLLPIIIPFLFLYFTSIYKVNNDLLLQV